MAGLTYDPGVFSVDSIDAAKWVILNPDGVHTPEERWEIETRYILDIVDAYMPVRDATCLDYGTGLGRLAKPLIETKGWAVIGADISASMRKFAVSYVNSPRFSACDPAAVDQLMLFGLKVDFALAVWSLQHCRDVAADIARIVACLKPGGRLFILNAMHRLVPTRETPWADDGADIWAMLSQELLTVWGRSADKTIVPAPEAYWGIYEAPTR